MDIMQSSPSAGHRGINGSDEGISGGWHATNSTASLSTGHTLEHHTSRLQKTKSKAKEGIDTLQRTPRRMAASKAMEQVMRKSAPPAAVMSSSRKIPSEAAMNSTSTTAEASTSSAGPSSSSPPLQRSISIEQSVRQREVRSSSPTPSKHRSSVSEQPSSPPRAESPTLEADKSVVGCAELEQFHFQAAPDSKTTILPRPPPSLPYDSSYLPLSPNGVDQTGHILVPPSATTLDQGTAKGVVGETAKAGRGNIGPSKKVLPGQELEEHFVSQTQGHRAMPWGLKATLMQKQMGGERARTKMGTLKRTALRDHRRGKIQTSLKMEEDIVSEVESPCLPLIEISEVTASGMPGLEEVKEDDQTPIESSSPLGLEEQMEVEVEDEPKEVLFMQQTLHPDLRIESAHSPRKQRTRRKSELAALSLGENVADEMMLSESSSQEGTSGSSAKRPREAHKRLKVVGGYYTKLALHRQDPPVGTEELSAPALQLNEASGSSSRGTSFAPEEAVLSTAISNEERSSSPTPSSKQVAKITGSLRRMTATPHTQSSPSKLVHASGEALNADAKDAGNNDFCETCQGIGHFICCDGCPRSFHFACINPPLDIDELPSTIGDASDTWYCNVCRVDRESSKEKKKKGNAGLFGPLTRLLEQENPTIFALPLDVRNYFKGVATANDGSYVNSSMLRSIKVNKFGLVDEREPLRLKDKNGKPILCFRCGESAMPVEDDLHLILGGERIRPARRAAQIAKAAVTSQSGITEVDEDGKKGWRKIISCDFCNLHWHLDCLDPPLANMPSLSRKWMCPNHVEHVLPSERIPKSVANSTTVHELPLPCKDTIGPGKHYRMRVVNDGQIDIIPDPMDTYTGPAHDAPGAAFGKTSGSSEKGWDEVTLPAYKGYPTVFGSQNNVKFRYRIPEKVIRLDFWSKAELQREKMAEVLLREQRKSRRDGLDLLALVANAASLETEHQSESGKEVEATPLSKSNVKRIVDGVFSDQASLAEKDHPFVEPGQEPVSLLRQSYIAGEYEREFDGIPEPQSKGKTAVSNPDDEDRLREALLAQSDPPLLHSGNQTELKKLQAIKELIAYKGRDALLRFLLE